jgi:HK97 family phage prohead protease
VSSYLLRPQENLRIERPPRVRCRAAAAGSLALVEAPGDRPAGDGRTLRGTFSVFDTWQEIRSPIEGHFLERIQPNAFTKTIKENADRVQLLYSHGHDPVLGTLSLGLLRSLTTDSHGAHYEAELFPSVHPLLLEGLREKRYGSSFRARIIKEEFDPKPGKSAWNPSGLPESVVRELKLIDVGPTSLPAYPQTSAQIRKLEDVGSRARPDSEPRPPWWLEEDDGEIPYWQLTKREERHAVATRTTP